MLLLSEVNKLIIILELGIRILDALVLNAHSLLQDRVITDQIHDQRILFSEEFALNFLYIE